MCGSETQQNLSKYLTYKIASKIQSDFFKLLSFRVVCYAAVDLLILISPEPSRVPRLQQIHLKWYV